MSFQKQHLSDGEQEERRPLIDHDTERGEDDFDVVGISLRHRRANNSLDSVHQVNSAAELPQPHPKGGAAFRPILDRGEPAFVPEQVGMSSNKSQFWATYYLGVPAIKPNGDISQFRRSDPSTSVPWGSVALGTFLLICGAGALLVLASDVYQGYDNEEEEAAQFRKQWEEVEDQSMLKVMCIKDVCVCFIPAEVLVYR